MPTRIAQRIVRWHPFILTAVLLAGLIAQLSASDLTIPPLARGLLMLTPLGPTCVWLWAVFHVARRASPVAISAHWDWVFAFPPVISLAAGLAGWSTHNSPAASAVFLSLFVGLSLSARTLENVDAANGSASVGRLLATALLMYAAPIGMWVLRPKILRVAERSRGTSFAAW